MSVMGKKCQRDLLLDAIRGYQDGLMPLGVLVDKVEGIMDTFQGGAIRDNFFDARLALEEVYARMQSENFDFQRYGKPVVDRALKEMLTKADLIQAQ